jgi:glyoxylase-like metal-dependent hydrolase (beta-lactamase superfamily II)
MEVESFVVPPLDNNIYLVYDAESKEAALVDTALGAAKVLPRIARLGLTLTTVVNTHGHHDHVADNAAVVAATGAKLAIHEADAHRLAEVAKQPRDYMPTPPPPSKADVLLKEGSIVKVGYSAPENQLFTGDTLLRGTFGDANGPGASPAMMYRSLARLYAMPPETRVLPGHGAGTRVGDEAWIANLRYAAPH